MAYTYVWPASLPQVPQKGYSEDIGINILRTPMDAGPAKLRVRGKKPAILNLSFIMTSQQIDTLENFIVNTIKGTARFGFLHPRKNIVVETRIVPQNDGVFFKLQYLAPNYYTVGLTFEILP